MNILQILPELNVGGVERGTLDLANYLTAHGHKSVVVSNGGKLVAELEQAGTKHFKLPVHKKNLLTMLRMVKPLREIIKQEAIDIVHARSRVPAWIAYFACRKTKANFLTTCHGYYRNPLFSQVMGWGKLVIVISEAIGRHMLDKFGVPMEGIRRIPRGVDLAQFKERGKESRDETKCTVSIIGRITPLKGHIYFLKAMAKVKRHVPFLRVWVIGDVPENKVSYRQELELWVQRLGSKDQVSFLGGRKDIPELLAQTDILVLSTVTQEGFGRVILEAQASGVPVVATKVGGVVDIIDDEKTGLMVMPKDTEAMAKAVIRLWQDKKLCEAIVEAAKKKLVANFTIEHMAQKTLKVYEELLNTQNILVIKMGSLGDVVLVTVSLKAIRKHFPAAKIFCFVGKESREILQHCPYIDELLVIDYKGDEKGISGLFKFSRKLRRQKFDIIIDFQNNRLSHLLAFLAFPKESYGFDNKKWSFLLSDPVKGYQDDIPPVRQQFQVLDKLGISYKENTFLELWPTRQDERFAKEFLDAEWLSNSKALVGINISASAKWRTKNWPVEYMARLCDLLAERNIRAILTGAPEDKELARYLLTQTKSKPVNAVGRTNMLQLAAIIKRCHVYVTADSAPLHVAAAMQIPVVALFGPTAALRHTPPAKKIAVIQKQLSCSPCYSKHCRIMTHACMKDIKPAEVLAHIEIFIKEAVAA